MIASQLLKWYLNHGLEVDNITAFVKYTPKTCFKRFADEVSAARRKADAHTRDMAAGNTAKLISNALYGKTITNKEIFATVSYCEQSNTTQYTNAPLFRHMQKYLLLYTKFK